MRFRLRTMLATLAATALIAGGGRYWYDLQVRPSRAEALVLGSLEFRDVDPRLSIEAPAWWKLPPRVVNAINTEICAFLQQPEARKRLADVGFDVVNKGPADFAAQLREELVFWRKVVEQTKVKID